MDHANDEDTNGSFEIVDKLSSDSGESDGSDTKTQENKKDDGEIEDEKKTQKHDEKPNKEPEMCNKTLKDDLSDLDKEEEWMDILGSEQLLKKVLKEGKPDSRPERLDICKIKFTCKVNDYIVDQDDCMEIQLGDGEVIQGLDLALPLMNVGEIAELKVGPRFGYGSLGNPPHVLPNTTLHYTVELLSSIPEVDIETMNVETRRQIGINKKEFGNWWFKRDEHTFAIHCYKRALEYLDYTESDEVEAKVKHDADLLIEDRIKVYNNMAAAQMKLGSYNAALESVNHVLKFEPNNLKALFRKGKILGVTESLTEAMTWLNKALDVEPDSLPVQREIRNTQILLKKQNDRERNLYKKMLGKSDVVSKQRSFFNKHWTKLLFVIGSLIALMIGIFFVNYLKAEL